ncbi:MAG: TonB-dependent receptor [Opitutaceae bacterium]|nr:TonB-dependent receptor [Opitutaceae bacterium]
MKPDPAHVFACTRTLRFRRPALALFLLCFGSLALAQGTVVGNVTNAATGATLEGARVQVKGTTREVLTDELGSYRIENVPPGNIVLAVSYTGLQTSEISVGVGGGAPTRRDIGLTADIYLLSNFVVASEREGNAKAITLQRDSLGVKNIVSADAFGGLAGNPADLAMRLPGVEGESVGGDMRYLRIRGLHQNLSSITQDGNRLADAASAGATREFQFQTVSSDAIERIEVTKSPTPDQDGDSIGGTVNLVSKSAFDSSPERRIRASAGAIWRAADPRDQPRQNASVSYSEVFGRRFGVSLNLAYRPHGSIIDVTTQNHQLLPPGTEGPAYQYQLTAQDFRNIRIRAGAGLKLDYKLSEQVRFFTNFQHAKHTEHSDHSQATWQTNQGVAATDAAGNFTGTNGIIPGYTDYETRVRPVAASQIAINSQATYKLGTTDTLNIGAVHRHRGLHLDYDLYSSRSKAYYPGNNTFTFTLRNIGFNLTKDDRLFPTVTQTVGPDWTRLENYTDNLYSSARMVSWDNYLGGALNVKKFFETRVPFYIKTGIRLRRQSRDMDNTPYNTRYVGPDGVLGPDPANGGRNDDNLAQFGQMNRPYPDTRLKRYGFLPFPALQSPGRPQQIDPLIAANPTHWRRNLATDLQTALTGHQQFDEEIRAAYLMGGVQFGRLGVLTGVRIEDTKTEGEGALQVITPEERARRAAWVGPLTDPEIERRAGEEFGRRQKRSGDYRSVFPGLHLKYRFRPNILARFSYSENIGRPNIGQLIPRTTVNYDNQTVSTSNPGLEPQWAENFDLSAEIYFEPAGMFTVGAFQKDISKFIYTSGGAVIGEGEDNGFSGEYAGFAKTTQYNGGFAKVRGVEVSYNQQFTFLPGRWKALGAFANLTRMKAEGNYGAGNAIALAPNPRVAGFNPFIANVGISYLHSRVNLRASYNYRHKYLTGFNANESRAVYSAARPTLDLKALYNINRHFSVYLDVVNVLMQPDRQTQFGFGRPQTTHLMRPQFYFGINARK